MSVLIKGMKMPKNCFECVCKHKIFSEMRCYEFPDFEFDETEKFPHMEDRSHYCPLVPVPPHGDLIDIEEQMQLMQACEYDTYDDYNRAFDMLDNAPTIIPAERLE